MTFANLWAFWFLAVALPITVLYLFRIRRRRQDVPNLAIWRTILMENRTTFLLKRLRRVFSLLLQLLILSLLVLALTKPVLDVFFQREPFLVLILDSSASMQTIETEDGASVSRFEAARRAAAHILDVKPDRTQAMLIAADRDLHVLCPFTEDSRLLGERLETARGTLYPADLVRACSFAAEVLLPHERGRILLLSDGTGPRTDALSQAVAERVKDHPGARIEVSCLSFGHTGENVGILRFAARKNEAQKTDEVLFAVRNFSAREKRVALEYREGSTLRKNIPPTLQPGEEAERVFSTALPAGDLLTLTLTPADAFAPDNTAYAVARPETRFRILLVSSEEDRFFYVQALHAMEEAVHEDSLTLTPEAFRKSPPAAPSPFDLVIFVNTSPPASLAPGNYLLVNCDAPALFRTDGTLADQPVTDWQRTHPINRYLSLHDLVVGQARRVLVEAAPGRETEETEVLCRSPATPLMLARETTTHKFVYIGFDAQHTVLPFRVAFPALLRNVLNWTQTRTTALFRPQYATGDIIRPLAPLPGENDLPARITFLVGEQEVEHPLVLDAHRRFAFAATDTVAPCRIEMGGQTWFTAVNLNAPSESAIAPAAATAGANGAAARRATAFGLRTLVSSAVFWRLLALLATVVLLAEWLLFHRRVTE